MGQLIYFCAGADQSCLPANNIKALLLNTLDHGATDNNVERAKHMCHIAKPSRVLLDSSGYQLLTAQEKRKKISFDWNRPMRNTSKESNLSPEHVMRVAAIHQPQIVIGLDFPIRKLEGEVAQQIEFYEKLGYNTKWAYESFEWRNALAPQIQYFQPIQCYTLEHFDIFLNNIKGVQYDGISMPIRTLKPDQLCQFLIGFHQRGITRVHLLGTSNLTTIAICAYAAQHMFDWVSLDSTSWRIAADKAEFIRPQALTRRKLKTGIDVSHYPPNSCSCPNCRGRSFTDLQALSPRRNKVDALRRHNWWALNNAISDAFTNADDLTGLERFVKRRFSKPTDADEIMRILTLTDCLKNIELETVSHLLEPNPKRRKPTRRKRKKTKPQIIAPATNQ